MAVQTGINANAFADLVNKNAPIDIAKKSNALLNAILGNRNKNTTPGGNAGRVQTWTGMDIIEGNGKEFRLMDGYPSPTVVVDGNHAISTATYETINPFKTVTFDATRWIMPIAIPNVDLDKIKGTPAKTASYSRDLATSMSRGVLADLNEALNSNSNQSSTAIGGWRYAVDNDNTYAGIDRSDAANANWRSLVTAVSGNITRAKLDAWLDELYGMRGAEDLFMVAAPNVYGFIKTMVHEKTTQDRRRGDKWDEFGGRYLRYGDVPVVLDEKVPTGVLGILDAKSLRFGAAATPSVSGPKDADHLTDAKIMTWADYFMFVCVNPRCNAKLTAITGVA